MEKRYQVFVSSTFWDLEEERQQVMQALLELDCMPAGMELFPAANSSQWDLIKGVIDDCDYYILIVGGRYGTVGPDGISYTEAEYRYAEQAGKPTIAFLHRDPGQIAAAKSEVSPAGQEKLQAFRAMVEKKLCKHWQTPHELGSAVSRSLVQLIRRTPAVGWVRASDLASQEAVVEILKLKKTIDELQSQLAHLKTSAPSGSELLRQGDDDQDLRYTYRDRYRIEQDAIASATWNEIFSSIAPLMIDELSDHGFRIAVNTFIAAHAPPEQRDLFSNSPDVSLSREDFQTIKVQLRALGLISMSNKARSVKDPGTYWTLTQHGDAMMTQLRAVRRPT